MKLFRIIFLLPFSFLYGIGAFFRNKFFDWKILKETSFNISIINVGNLSMGGTGKTPHVEYLINLLKNDYVTAVLSRGYGRKTKGYVSGNSSSSYMDIGDEPMQYIKKYPDIQVSVDEKRVQGVQKLLAQNNKPDVIILDDAFQHRHIKPGLNILLTDYYRAYSDDMILPSGTLREFRSGAKRADIIILTKTNAVIFPTIAKDLMLKKLRIQPHQKLFFSYIKYLPPVALFDASLVFPKHITSIFMITGIANSYPFEEYLKNFCSDLRTFTFPDHHEFAKNDLAKIVKEFDDHLSNKKVIVTTEKDVSRLQSASVNIILKNHPVFYIPISIAFHNNEPLGFDDVVKNYMKRTSKKTDLRNRFF